MRLSVLIIGEHHSLLTGITRRMLETRSVNLKIAVSLILEKYRILRQRLGPH